MSGLSATTNGMAVIREVVDDVERGRTMGRGLWQASLVNDRAAGYVWGLTRVVLEAGVRAATLDPPVQDLDAFHRGLQQGLAAQAVQLRNSHAERALCDPSSPDMCEYCRWYAGGMESSEASKRRWEADTQDPTRLFAIFGRQSKVHTRDCSTIQHQVREAEKTMERLTPAAAWHGGIAAEWPHLLDREEAIAVRRHRCRTCVPDLPGRVPTEA
jgi:hypothetical protein